VLRTKCARREQLTACVQALPLGGTLVVHALAARLLCLPLWPSDLARAAACGHLPFLAFSQLCTLHTFPPGVSAVAAGLLEAPALRSSRALAGRAVAHAEALELALPAPNAGAPALELMAALHVRYCGASGGYQAIGTSPSTFGRSSPSGFAWWRRTLRYQSNLLGGGWRVC
jgi:hypothetical protein